MYHVTDDGQVGRCRAATPESCPFAKSSPFGTHFQSEVNAGIAARAWGVYANQLRTEENAYGAVAAPMPNINTFARIDEGTMGQIETSIVARPGDDHFYRTFDVRLMDEDGSMGGDVILSRRRGTDPNFAGPGREIHAKLADLMENGSLDQYENYTVDAADESMVYADVRDPLRNSPVWTVSLMEEKELGEIIRAPYKSIPVYDSNGSKGSDELNELDSAEVSPLSDSAVRDRTEEQMWHAEDVSKRWIEMIEGKIDSRQLTTLIPPSNGRSRKIMGWSATEHSLRFEGSPTQNWNRIAAENADRNPFFANQINRGVEYSWTAHDTPTGIVSSGQEPKMTITRNRGGGWTLTSFGESTNGAPPAEAVFTYATADEAASAGESVISQWGNQYERAKQSWRHNLRLFVNGVDEFENAKAMKAAAKNQPHGVSTSAPATSETTGADGLFRKGSLMGKFFS